MFELLFFTKNYAIGWVIKIMVYICFKLQKLILQINTNRLF